jgi:hypothetical protein
MGKNYQKTERDQYQHTLDIHDETYALHMQKLYATYVEENARKAFNVFSEDLMCEPKLSRFALLEALKDFKLTDKYVAEDWLMVFEDEANNFRPHQGCIIA